MRILLHDDYDGLVSAALVTASMVDQGYALDTITYGFVDHSPEQMRDWELRWPTLADGDQFAIVDFRYHPSAVFWADHHPTGCITEQDRQHFVVQRTMDPQRFFWDTSAPSCAELLARSVRLSRAFDDLVAGATMVDQARYPSAAAYFEAALPQIALTITHRSLSAGQKAELIRRMVRSASAQHALLAVSTEASDAIARERMIRDQVHAHLECADGVVVADLVDTGLPLCRYAPYYYFPDIPYAIAMYQTGADVRVSLGRNPWRADFSANATDLGAVAKQAGGGGHAYAAGVTFAASEHASPAGAARAWVQQTRKALAA